MWDKCRHLDHQFMTKQHGRTKSEYFGEAHHGEVFLPSS